MAGELLFDTPCTYDRTHDIAGSCMLAIVWERIIANPDVLYGDVTLGSCKHSLN